MDLSNSGTLDSYRLISGAVVDLREVPPAAQTFVNDLALRLAQGQGYGELIGRVMRHDAPIYQGMSPLAPGADDLPAVQVARDLSYRAGLAEGAIAAKPGETRDEALPSSLRARVSRSGKSSPPGSRLTSEEIVTVGEAMNILGITRQAVINAVRNGKVHGEQHGKLWILSRDDVLEYRDERERRRARGRGR